MPTDAEFLAAIIADPDDDAPRLIFADWLDENGRSERAEFIRVQCAIAQMDDAGEGTIDEEYGHTCCEDPCPVCAAVERYDALQKRQSELLDQHCEPPYRWPCWRDWIPDALLAVVPDGGLILDYLTFRRGFVESIRCSAEAWLGHSAFIARAAPVRTVRLTSLPTVYRNADPTGGYTACLGPAWNRRWYGIEYDDRHILPHLFAADWPGIEFMLPIEGRVVQITREMIFYDATPALLEPRNLIRPDSVI